MFPHIFSSAVKFLKLWSNVPHWIRLYHDFDDMKGLQSRQIGDADASFSLPNIASTFGRVMQ